MENMRLQIEGMSCGGCVNSVRTALARLPGVEVREVEVGRAGLVLEGGRRRALFIAGAPPKTP